jgi:hypothetical protein
MNTGLQRWLTKVEEHEADTTEAKYSALWHTIVNIGKAFDIALPMEGIQPHPASNLNINVGGDSPAMVGQASSAEVLVSQVEGDEGEAAQASERLPNIHNDVPEVVEVNEELQERPSPRIHVTVRAQNQVRPRQAELVDLFRATMAFSQEISVDDMTTRAEHFAKLLTRVRYRVRGESVRLSQKKIADIQQVMFGEAFGRTGACRICNLIAEVSPKKVGLPDAGIWRRAYVKSQDQNLPILARQMFADISRFQSSQFPKKSVLGQINHVLTGLSFWSAWSRVSVEAQASYRRGDGVWRGIFAADEVESELRQGVNVVSLVKAWIIKTIDWSPKGFNDLQQKFKGVWILVERFGEGVILFMPKTSTAL